MACASVRVTCLLIQDQNSVRMACWTQQRVISIVAVLVVIRLAQWGKHVSLAVTVRLVHVLVQPLALAPAPAPAPVLAPARAGLLALVQKQPVSTTSAMVLKLMLIAEAVAVESAIQLNLVAMRRTVQTECVQQTNVWRHLARTEFKTVSKLI